MKTERDSETVRLSSPAGNSSVQVDHDCQKVTFKMNPGKVHSTENASRCTKDGLQRVTGRDDRGKMSSVLDTVSNSLKEQSVVKDSLWMLDSSSQAYSGPEDNSTDPHETLTETSTLTFVDAHTTDESGENHSLHGLGVEMVYLKEFVLIDDDDDGDMSLREKMVTDLSVMDGNAADLVCGRLFSTSSASVSEWKEEAPAPAAPPPEEEVTAYKEQRCCLCTLL